MFPPILSLHLAANRRVAFRTDPPLSDEVWDKFCEGRFHGNLWEKNDDLLVWVGGSDLTDTFLDQAEQHLTLIESELQNQDTRATNIKQNYLEQISKQTGRPVV